MTVPVSILDGIEEWKVAKRRVLLKRAARKYLLENGLSDPFDGPAKALAIRANHCISDETDAYIVTLLVKKGGE